MSKVIPEYKQYNHKFYKDIESPIRELVKRLRDAGLNTRWSCGHDMIVCVDFWFDIYDPLTKMQVITQEWLRQSGYTDITFQIQVTISTRNDVIQCCEALIKIDSNKQRRK